MDLSPNNQIDRRTVLLGTGTALTTALAGCSTSEETDTVPEDTPNNTFHSPNDTTTATKTPEDVANHTNTEETTTEQTTTPVEETTTPEEWEDLTGEEIYENNLPPRDTKIDTKENGEMTLGEFTDHVTQKYDLFKEDPYDTLIEIQDKALAEITQEVQPGHANKFVYKALENIIHSQYNTDEARVFNDVTRPRQGGFLTTTIQLEDQLYHQSPRPTSIQPKGLIQPLQQAGAWNPHNNATGNGLDYQNWRNLLEREDIDFEEVEKGVDGAVDIETSLSYDNSTGWLAPTQDFHAMAGAVHHYAADQEDVEVTRFENMQPEDFNVEDVVRFRDEVNDLKQEYGHDLGEDERIVLDAEFQDGDYQLRAETTDDWEITIGPYVKFPE